MDSWLRDRKTIDVGIPATPDRRARTQFCQEVMSIEFHCYLCGQRLRVADQHLDTHSAQVHRASEYVLLQVEMVSHRELKMVRERAESNEEEVRILNSHRSKTNLLEGTRNTDRHTGI